MSGKQVSVNRKRILAAEHTTAISPRSDHTAQYFNPLRIAVHLWQFRDLIGQLAWREVMGRYKNSFLGFGYSLVIPLVMLAIYTFVFSVIFRAKWGMGVEEGRIDFAMALFMGLITFSIFAEVVNAAPLLILSNAGFVKKVVFPLETLVLVRFLSVMVHAVMSLVILFAGLLVFRSIPATALLLPVVWAPLLLFSLGIGYFLASLGVFIRDLGVTVSIVVTMLFFLSPIFYPVQAVPEQFKVFCQVNPIAIFVEDARRVVLWGQTPHWLLFVAGLVLSLIVFVLGFVWFMKSKKTFADVV